jgi:tetratricopeptide (TPR) repeat protein
MTRPATAQELFFAALDAQTGGRPDTAEQLYREALALAPDRPSILNNLSTVLLQQGKYEECRSHCERLLQLDPDNAGAWMTLGSAEAGLQRMEAALAHYSHALLIAPGHAPALANRGDILARLGRSDEALADFDLALQRSPDLPEALLNRGNLYAGLERHDDAAADYRRVLAAAPAHAAALNNLGSALAALGRHAEALDCLSRALQAEPGRADALANRSGVLAELGRFSEALQDCHDALAADPGNPLVLCQLGNVLLRDQQPEAAIAACERAIAADPSCVDAFQYRGNARVSLGRYPEALADYAHAQTLAPDSARPRWNEALCRLLLGDFEQGWKHYGRGWEIGQRGKSKPQFTRPEWDGLPLDGTLLAWGEQGIGDQILHCSMLEQLFPFARRLMVAVDRRLVPLLQRSSPGIRVLPLDALPSLDGFDAQVALGDLGRHLRRSWDSFPAGRRHYLTADTARTQALRARLGGNDRLLCGISWRSTNPAVGTFKSLALNDLAPLLAMPGVQCVDLQYGDTADERRGLAQGEGNGLAHVDDIDNFHDIDALASLIDACDIVVSVSNTTVHLAGALGKPALVMLPHALGRIWYWHEHRDTSPWYPSCRLLRQAARGEWAPVIATATAAVAAALEEKTFKNK